MFVRYEEYYLLHYFYYRCNIFWVISENVFKFWDFNGYRGGAGRKCYPPPIVGNPEDRSHQHENIVGRMAALAAASSSLWAVLAQRYCVCWTHQSVSRKKVPKIAHICADPTRFSVSRSPQFCQEIRHMHVLVGLDTEHVLVLEGWQVSSNSFSIWYSLRYMQ